MWGGRGRVGLTAGDWCAIVRVLLVEVFSAGGGVVILVLDSISFCKRLRVEQLEREFSLGPDGISIFGMDGNA